MYTGGKEEEQSSFQACGHYFLPVGELWWTMHVGVGDSDLLCGWMHWQVNCQKMWSTMWVWTGECFSLKYSSTSHKPLLNLQRGLASLLLFVYIHEKLFIPPTVFVSHQVLCNCIFLACVPKKTFVKRVMISLFFFFFHQININCHEKQFSLHLFLCVFQSSLLTRITYM